VHILRIALARRRRRVPAPVSPFARLGAG
jgi:hypothetical protein